MYPYTRRNKVEHEFTSIYTALIRWYGGALAAALLVIGCRSAPQPQPERIELQLPVAAVAVETTSDAEAVAADVAFDLAAPMGTIGEVHVAFFDAERDDVRRWLDAVALGAMPITRFRPHEAMTIGKPSPKRPRKFASSAEAPRGTVGFAADGTLLIVLGDAPPVQIEPIGRVVRGMEHLDALEQLVRPDETIGEDVRVTVRRLR